MNNNLIFFFDIETGGLTTKSTPLTFYGRLVDFDTFEMLDEIELLLKPDDGIYAVEAEAMALNNINLIKHDKVAMKMSDGRALLKNFIIEHTTRVKERGGPKISLGGHNIHFDIMMIEASLLSDFSHFFSYHHYDTGSVAQLLKSVGLFPKDKKISLKNLADHFNIKPEGEIHNAKIDVKLTISVLKCAENILKTQISKQNQQDGLISQ